MMVYSHNELLRSSYNWLVENVAEYHYTSTCIQKVPCSCCTKPIRDRQFFCVNSDYMLRSQCALYKLPFLLGKSIFWRTKLVNLMMKENILEFLYHFTFGTNTCSYD